ncbi:RibD family protein [Oryzicola mucosus]|uniref:RibD family protein n=1 Tax=Oryzicola mucosus TaxID=2767425 RepID=A0A8J6PPC3_9HYPH|nr:RibD family protein [Oryzicola mucosus]MBD0415305.1 RibD family protein [Oryzicola mucosus]
MRTIEMTDATWDRLMRLRNGRSIDADTDDAALSLYGPIASARGRFVLAQVGQSLDGRVATPEGDARDISGPEGLAHLHRCRALVEAVIVGVGTVKADDPRLSVRKAVGPDPVRVVVDCDAELSGDEGLFRDGGAPVILLQSREAPRKNYPESEVIRLPRHDCGLDPRDMLDALEERGLSRILVEGGARTIARFVDFGLLDRLHVSIAPLIIGSGPQGISLSPIESLSSAYRPKTDVYMLGGDVLFDCRFDPQKRSIRQSDQVEMADHA